MAGADMLGGAHAELEAEEAELDELEGSTGQKSLYCGDPNHLASTRHMRCTFSGVKNSPFPSVVSYATISETLCRGTIRGVG
mmetsp:Transcript_12363/g.18723  ORF Transcript_12363/g.18723 Transcript_12363/m.18723 type:complete len:82 (+) Transcript_12363:2012-2257(+)